MDPPIKLLQETQISTKTTSLGKGSAEEEAAYLILINYIFFVATRK